MSKSNGQFGFAIFLIIFGFFLLLDQLDFYSFGFLIRTWWPLILIYIGIQQKLKQSEAGIWPYVFIGGGSLWILKNLDFISFGGFSEWWPLIILGIGLYILFDAFKKSKPKPFNEGENEGYTSAIFSSNKKIVSDKPFISHSVTVSFGDAEIDFRDIEVINHAVIDISCSLGSTKLIFPENIAVEFTGTTLLGSVNDKRRERKPADKKITLTGFVFMGEIEIRD